MDKTGALCYPVKICSGFNNGRSFNKLLLNGDLTAIIYLVQASISKLGVAIATTAIVFGQVSTALLIDHFGLFGLREIPFTWWKLLGLIFLATGAKLMLN